MSDFCRHGVYVGGSGYDLMCHRCEMDDPDPTPRELYKELSKLRRELNEAASTFWTHQSEMVPMLLKGRSVGVLPAVFNHLIAAWKVIEEDMQASIKQKREEFRSSLKWAKSWDDDHWFDVHKFESGGPTYDPRVHFNVDNQPSDWDVE